MKIVFAVFLFVLPVSVKGEWIDTLSNYFSQFETIKELEGGLKEKIYNLRIEYKSQRIKRELDFGFSHSVCYLRFKEPWLNYYNIYLFSKNDTIVFGYIKETDPYNEKVILKKAFKKTDKIISWYIAQHKLLYGKKYTMKRFVKEMTILIVYGFSCGLHRSYFPKEAVKMKRNILFSNQRKLSQKLKSISPELQAYGTTGLLQLEKKGKGLSRTNEKIINHLKKRNTDIYVCYGCLYGRTSAFLDVLGWYDKFGKKQKRRR